MSFLFTARGCGKGRVRYKLIEGLWKIIGYSLGPECHVLYDAAISLLDMKC